jgi:hypothetical protein
VTALWIILFCVGFVIFAGTFRRRPGVGVADAGLLVILLGTIAIANMVVGRFIDTGGIGWTIAAIVAIGFAIDALYGLMAPERQRRRDQRLGEFMRRRKRA